MATKKALTREEEKQIFEEFKEKYSNNFVKGLKADYKEVKGMLETLLSVFQGLDCSDIKTPKEYLDAIKKCAEEAAEQYPNLEYEELEYRNIIQVQPKDNDWRIINKPKDDRLEIDVRLPRIIYWEDDYTYGEFKGFVVKHLRKRINEKGFDATKFHKDVCSKLDEANGVLLIKIAETEERMIGKKNRKFFVEESIEYYRFVSKNPLGGYYWDLVETLQKEFRDRIEELKKGDEIKFKYVKAKSNRGWEGEYSRIGAFAPMGLIGYLPSKAETYFYDGFSEGRIELSGKVHKVVPKSKLGGALKPLVEVSIKVKEVKKKK